MTAITLTLTATELERVTNALEVHATNLAARATRRVGKDTAAYLRDEAQRDLDLVAILTSRWNDAVASRDA